MRKWEEHLPNEDLEVCEENLKLFFQTMFERQEIWHRRFILKQEKPWTENEIFRDYKFTNVYRELDRSSQFQIENIIKNKDLSDLELVWQTLFYRMFNNPDFFKFIKNKKGYCVQNYKDYNPETFYDLMQEFRETGGLPFTSSYFIHPFHGITNDKKYSYDIAVQLHKKIPILLEIMRKKNSVVEDLIKELEKIDGVSKFMSHEYFQDLCYINRYNCQIMKFDQNSMTISGPGSRNGIRLIFPSTKGYKNEIHRIYELRDIADDYLAEFGQFKYLPDYDGITLHQIEMWLCEFQKYFKMQIGEGKQRSKFIPKSNV